MKIMVWLASGWGESVSAVNPGLSAKSPAVWRRSACDWGREKGRAGHEPALLGRFSLTGIDAVPPAESSDRLQRRAGRGGGRGLGQISWFAALTCEQSVLLGPVERQIELAQTRGGAFTGLPPLQDRLDQLRAQEGKANQTPNVAPGDAVTERSGTTGGELLKPRAPAGDRPDQRRITRDLSICCASPG